jgi:ATP-dependent helicase HrpB
MKEFGQYPIDAHLQSIAGSLAKGSTCLIKAEPGAGKTTRAPIHLLSSIQGEILVLEPRRLAARLSAERSAWFLGENCGQQVGFRIRQDKKVSEQTRLTFITEGLFVRLLRNNPALEGVGAVIIDEFHERNIHTDIALALVRQLQRQRPDLKLAVMSATLDTAELEKYLEDAEVFDIAGRTFPVEIEYIDEPAAAGSRGRKRWEDDVCSAVRKMLNDPRCPGNILVFLTGIAPIMQIKQKLEQELSPREAAVLPLAADIPFKEQQRVFLDDGVRKIVLSTNVAETSLTIPGITGVIDWGLAKIPAHAPWSGMPTLEIKRISQASAIQRAGRAGRTRPGLVYRLYSKPEFINRDKFTSPDIQRIDISHALLEIMNLGYSPDYMPWFQPPAEENLESALQLLTYLGAITRDGKITGFGKKLSMLPLHPRLSAVTLRGCASGCGEDALLAACLISEGFVLKRDASYLFSAGDDAGEPCDIAMQIDLIKAALHKKPEISPYPFQLIDLTKRKRILNLYRGLAKTCRLASLPPPQKTNVQKLSRCLLQGFPDRVARLRDRKGKKNRKDGQALYTFCLGRGGMIGNSSAVYKHKPGFLIAIDAVESLKQDAARGVNIQVCSSLTPETLMEDPAGLIKKERREEFDAREGAHAVWQSVYYGKLKVEDRKTGLMEEGRGLARALAENWPFPFDSGEALGIYHSRVHLLNAHGIVNNCPLFEGEMRELFFEMICANIATLKELSKTPLEEHIYRQLSDADRAVLEAYVPLEMKLRNGKRIKINYREGKEPWAEILIQDCYGLKETPAIIQGKQPLVLHLLGPNHRPAQVTGDLPGFWRGSYQQVSKELSRRYPKHYWPDHPSSAAPVMLKRFVNQTGSRLNI